MQSDTNFWGHLFAPTKTDSTPVRIEMVSLKKNGRPLLLLPRHKHAAAATFTLYPAQTAKARFIRSCLQNLNSVGIRIGSSVQLALSKGDGFINFLSGLAGSGTVAPSFGVLAGNPASPSQRFMILVFNQQQQPVAVVKTGINPEARSLVERESRFLQSAPANKPGLPRILGTFHDDRLNAFALEFYPGDSPKSTGRNKVDELLSAWVDPSQTARLQELAEWQALERTVAADTRAAAGCDQIRAQRIHPVLYHGDFAPWNIKAEASRQWTVLDWERSQVRGIPGWDWFHYFLQSAILIEKLAGRALLGRAEDILNSAEFQKYARATQIEGIKRSLMAAYLLYSAHVIEPAEGREQTDQLWRLLRGEKGN